MAWSDPDAELTFVDDEIVTHTKLNKARDDFKEIWRELAYVEFTADVTLAGTDTDIVSSGAITYTAHPILIEFFCPSFHVPEDTQVTLKLKDGATSVGDLGGLELIDAGGSGKTFAVPVHLGRRLTPTAAAHTYKITGLGALAVARAGAGGSGVRMPGYIRVTQKGSA